MKQRLRICLYMVVIAVVIVVAIQYRTYLIAKDPACTISFTDYLRIRWLVVTNPEGEYLSDHFVIALLPGWQNSTIVRTGRKIGDHTVEGGIYVMKKLQGGWTITMTGFWADIDSRPRHAETTRHVAIKENAEQIGEPNSRPAGARGSP